VLNRREFVTGTAALSAVGIAGAAPTNVSIVADPRDPIAGAQPVRWALQELEESLKARGVTVNKRQALAEAKSGELCILASGLASRSSA
jgi:hypothetical protein